MILDEAWHEISREAAILSESAGFPLWTTPEGWITAAIDQPSRGVLPHHGSWMVGDLPAILWLITSHARGTADYESWRDNALTWSQRLSTRTGVDAFASVSHMFLRGALLPMTAAKEISVEPLISAAAETITQRFLRIGYMKSFGSPQDHAYPFTTVDDVINLSIPLWYAATRRDDALHASAVSAAQLIGRRLVRPDGSCAQVLHFDQEGRPTTAGTYQGFSPDGCWSRGQAWAIYGFATIYRQTRDAEFLQLAEATARYWIDRVQDDPAPLWDFQLPCSEPPIRDSFAATLACAGLLELAASVESDANRQVIIDYASTMIERLAVKYVLGRPRGQGLVAGAALDVPHQHGIDCSVIVGDSYFVEAVWRLTQSGESNVVLPPR